MVTECVNRRRHVSVGKIIRSVVLHAVAVFLALTFFFPFVYMVLCSLQPASHIIFAWPVQWIPKPPTFSNYATAWQTMHFARSLWNTVLIMVTANALQISSSVLVAYGFARFKNRFTEPLFIVLLATMMLPWIVTMVPSFVMFKYFGWIGTKLPLIIPAIGGSAYNIFMLRNFMRGIPLSLDEAAELDGAGRLRTLVQILLPNMKPILATLLVFAITGSWSDYVGPSIFLLNREDYTLSLALSTFKSLSGSMEWHHVMAGCVLVTLPMLVVLFSAQNVFMQGIVTSSVKG